MVKISKLPHQTAEQMIDETPKRNAGQWKELIAEVLKTGQGAQVTDITRGQVAALIRQCKTDGIKAVAINKYTGVLMVAPVPKKA